MLAHVLARLPSVDAVGIVSLARHFGSPQVRWQITATMGSAHRQTRESIEDAVEYQVGEEKGGLQRVTDDVSLIAAGG